MSTVFPAGIDVFSTKVDRGVVYHTDINNIQDSIVALETLLNTDTSGVWNVKSAEWGAVGNGVASDTVAVEAAAADCSAAGGGIVYFPPGTYLGPFSFDGVTNVTFLGAGSNSILRNGVTVTKTGVTHYFSRCNFENLCFDRAGYTTDAQGSVSILSAAITAASFGLKFDTVYHNRVHNCWFRACDYGVWLYNTGRTTVESCEVEICNYPLHLTGTGNANNGADCEIRNNRLQQFRIGIYANGGTGYIDGLVIAGNVFYTLNPFSEQEENVYVRRVLSPLINNNRLFYPGQENIYVESCDNIQITGNQCSTAGLASPIASAIKVVGSYQGSNLTYGVITGNDIYGPTKYGVELDADSGVLTVSGNNMAIIGNTATGYTGNMADITGVAHYGIYNAGKYCTIGANNINGMGQPTSAPQYDGSISGRDVHIVNSFENYWIGNGGKDNATNRDQKYSEGKFVERNYNDDHTGLDVTGVDVVNWNKPGSTDLATITGGQLWQKITMFANAAGMKIKHNTGNIFLKGAADITMTQNTWLDLIYDGTKWRD